MPLVSHPPRPLLPNLTAVLIPRPRTVLDQTRSSTLEPRPFGNNRPSSAAPQRLVGAGGTSTIAAGFRPGSGGARSRTARGVGAHANGNSRLLPPATGGSQPTTRQSPLFAPAALSATYGLLSDGARKVRRFSAQRGSAVNTSRPHGYGRERQRVGLLSVLLVDLDS